MRIAGLCLLLATPAFADPSDTREGAMAELGFEPVTAKQLGVRYLFDVAAVGLARTDGNERQGAGAATASAHVALTTRAACELLAAGGLVTARSEEGGSLAASQWTSFCPIGGNGHLIVDERVDWDVTPRLLAIPRLRPGPSRRVTVGISFVGGTKPLHGEDDPEEPTTVDWLQSGNVRMQTAVGWTRDSQALDVHAFLDAVLSTYIHRYEDDADKTLTFDVLHVRGEALATGALEDDTMVGGLSGNLARLEGLRAGVFRFGARLGGRLGAISGSDGADHKMNMINLVEGAVSAEVGPVRVAAERASFPTFDARVVADNRASAGIRGSRGKLRGRLEAAIAYTQIFSKDIYRKAVTGGFTAEADLDLGDHFSLRARSEVGRSLYAPGMILDEPRWASETMLIVATHAQRGVKR